jgi:hypothetical protein
MGAPAELTPPAEPPPGEEVAARRVVLATELGGSGGGLAATAAAAVCGAVDGGCERVLVAELSERERRAPTLLASAGARELEDALRAAGFESAAARGRVCWLSLPPGADGLDPLAAAIAAPTRAELVFAFVPPRQWTPALDRAEIGAEAGLLRADLPAQRALAALAVGELQERRMRARVAARALGRVGTRRSLAGIDPGGDASRRSARLVRGLIGPVRRQGGQALPLTMGACFLVIFAALLFALLAGSVTGAAATQRAADLAALSGARSMRDDLPRLLAPATLPNGAPNPAHMRRREYFGRADAAARQAAARNGVAARRVGVSFPDRRAIPPVRIGVEVRADVDRDLLVAERARARRRTPIRLEARAEAEASPPVSFTGMPATASGGGYEGPLAYRQGKPMRPDVAAAFDRMAAAARRAGHSLTINSGFRSDAEQARLFAGNPNPRMVAPPGKSLHRCGTELDLGPSSAYGWLARSSRGFGFVKRYSWESWHFGFVRGPAPCSAAGNSVGRGGSSDGRSASRGLPSFVPARYRAPIERSAARWNVSGALLAAQIEAESGFNPNAVSPAGARGIAQFMPATAASYGLRNPMDPKAAIDAQAHMMSDLLRRFRSVPLALAAYNAGPGAVASCRCVPPYPETRAYVARILALLDGAGAMLVPELEVRLVA